MTRWHELRALFDEAAELSGDARDALLRERTAHDPELARELGALLAADTRPLDTLEAGAAQLLRSFGAEPPADELCGVRVGEYEVEAHLASGGSSHVYRAVRRVAGAERRVALKVLRPGHDADELLERFRRERRTLAALEHPHVVAFLDAGALPDGRPFLAMEYVDGEPLTRWADGRPRRERVELFVRVLAAVQYAHGELVLHRDLKPSNVLVTGAGEPKLLDFGVASVLAAPGARCARPGPLTPSYASPEQLAGDPVGTTADVYALGLLLRETLTGEAHVGADAERSAPRRDARAPSAASLPADLAAVVARATDTAPARRYASADAFADDLRRWLRLEPVSARVASPLHRARLFARRHRWPLALGGALTAALALGWLSASLDRRLAQREASVGWRAHTEARVLARVFEGWLDATTAGDAALADEAARFLERALREELADYPEAETLARLSLAELYQRRGDAERARPHAARAAALARVTRGVGERTAERAAGLAAALGVDPTDAPPDDTAPTAK